MADWHAPRGPFDIPDVPGWVPRRLKPWLFIFFVLIIQFSGGVYLAAASDMAGTTALMQQDILMAGYASLVGMAINFAVMFRIKFRFSNRIQLLSAYSVIQLSGIASIYSAFHIQWEAMQWIMTGLLTLMMVMVLILVRTVHTPLHIPLLGIDWIGALLWAGFMLCFTFICVYGNYFDWWEAREIWLATWLGLACMAVNLWRATFLHHPYITFAAMRNRYVVRATGVYLVFFTLLATEHVFEHSYAAHILGFDDTNLIDLNWYVFAGIISLTVILVSYGPLRPAAIFPKWRTIRRALRHLVRSETRAEHPPPPDRTTANLGAHINHHRRDSDRATVCVAPTAAPVTFWQEFFTIFHRTVGLC